MVFEKTLGKLLALNLIMKVQFDGDGVQRLYLRPSISAVPDKEALDYRIDVIWAQVSIFQNKILGAFQLKFGSNLLKFWSKPRFLAGAILECSMGGDLFKTGV